LKKLRKKLEAIEKLKAKEEAGEILEKNQIEKLKTEKEIRESIKSLQI